MKIATLVLEYFKVLTWPAVTLLIVWQFRPHLAKILDQIAVRLKTAETLKVGVMGQEVQISGTAKELVNERNILLESGQLDTSTDKALAFEAATRELNNPMADLIGMILLKTDSAMSLEEVTKKLVETFNPKESPTQHSPFVIVILSKQVEKMLGSLEGLGYVATSNETYMLTPAGRDFFTRVQDRFGLFFAKFQALS